MAPPICRSVSYTWPAGAPANLRFEGPAAAGHGALDGNGDERGRLLFKRIAAEDYEIGELACFDGTFQILFVRSVGSIDGAHPNRFFYSNFLLGSPNVALGVGASHFRLQGHHGNEFSRRIIGGLRRADAGVQKTPQGTHAIEALGAVATHFFAVIIDVG